MDINDSTLTEEEKALLIPFNAAAHDLLRKRAADQGQITTCWLVMSNEAREQARQEVLAIFQARTMQFSMTMLAAEKFAEINIPKHMFEAWRRAEINSKSERLNNNPRASFAE